MSSKSLLLLGLLLACALLITPEMAAARELTEAASTSKENSKGTNGVEEDQYSGGGYPTKPVGYPTMPVGYPTNPGSYGGYPPPGSYGGNPGGGGGYCSYGCCGSGYNGACRCCSYRGEPMDTRPEAKPQN